MSYYQHNFDCLMKKTLHSLRKRPVRDRQIIAFVVALLLTVVIFGVWISTLGSLGNRQTQASQEKAHTPFTVLGNFFSTSFDDLRSSRAERREIIDSLQADGEAEVEESPLENPAPQSIEEIEQAINDLYGEGGALSQ